MDNSEDPLEADNDGFKEELSEILDHCQHVKMLMTSRKTINKLSHTQECPYIVYALSFESSLKLLI